MSINTNIEICRLIQFDIYYNILNKQMSNYSEVQYFYERHNNILPVGQNDDYNFFLLNISKICQALIRFIKSI